MDKVGRFGAGHVNLEFREMLDSSACSHGDSEGDCRVMDILDSRGNGGM